MFQTFVTVIRSIFRFRFCTICGDAFTFCPRLNLAEYFVTIEIILFQILLNASYRSRQRLN